MTSVPFRLIADVLKIYKHLARAMKKVMYSMFHFLTYAPFYWKYLVFMHMSLQNSFAEPIWYIILKHNLIKYPVKHEIIDKDKRWDIGGV